jgi:Family of unknown function (DUF5519)
VGNWRETFLDRSAKLDGVVVAEGTFGPGPALWVGKREVAHFDDEDTLDIRLTKAQIRARRSEFKADDRVGLRPGSSDWLEVQVRDASDVDFALSLVHDAITANVPTAPVGHPPTGADLARRRRFR